MMTPAEIAAMQADAEKGTPGPWVSAQMTNIFHIHPKGVKPGYQARIADVIYWGKGHGGDRRNPLIDDAKANARNIARVPDMIATIIAQAAEIERLRGLLGETA